ncbi:PAS domain S-box protein [Hydrogenophaga sp.]|uniref:PAS domain-containing sensor histidine kinase n=1 Tax=Hydrogenophaga sp. TaxID=1904254 RepID=UPI0026228E1E|nr:PAS domain S-box protein [Hydrogenophaga sp.]MCW5653715.1 PAS domain S-box protein [Hydrogenophaga sp.]
MPSRLTPQETSNHDITGHRSSKATMLLLTMLIGVAAVFVAVADLLLAPPGQREAWVSAILALIAGSCHLLVRKGYLRLVAHIIVAGLLLTAIFSVLTYGSVRTAVGFLFVGAVVGAGIFLERTALLVTLIATVAVLGLLTWAEVQGLLPGRPYFEVGVRVWIIYSATLLVVAIMVYHSRMRTRDAHRSQMAELERRKKTEQERDRNLERFARIFRTNPIPMVAQSARSGMILDVNPAFERCYGYQRAQVLGRQDAFLWARPQERETFMAYLFTARRAEQYPAQGLRADGSVFDALISSEMGDDREDRLIITTIADVSAQNEVLERLRRSEERFSKAFNFSPLNMTLTRLADGSFIEVNRAQDKAQGLSPEEHKGKTSVEIGAWLTQQDREVFVAKLLREGRIDGYETRMRHKDGHLVDTRVWAELVEVDGERCILSCTVNISDEKRREALLLNVARGVAAETGEAFFGALTRHLGEAVEADMVVIGECREDGRVRTLAIEQHGSAASNFSFNPQGTPCGQTLMQQDMLVCASGLAEQFPQATSLIASGCQAYLGKALRDADGTPIGVIFALWGREVEIGQGTQALIAIFASRANAELVRLRRDREIQQFNETLEQRVRERTADLQTLNAELDSFAYSVSHDLKSPLRAIDGFTQLLHESAGERLQADERQLLERVLQATARMGTLINDLLALARVSQGKLDRQLLDLSAMAEQVFKQERQRHPARDIRLRLTPGLWAHCDPRLTRIALENLFANAVKYSRTREVSEIEWGRLEAQGDQPERFFIRDNGVGFNVAYADKLFKPFQRLHMPSEFEGTGIGLATVRRIIERHGGSITGESQPGEGATFSFWLG